MRYLWHSLILLLLINAACRKNKPYNPYSDNGLPPATQRGAQMFACRVNGKPWISSKSQYAMGGRAFKDSLYVSGGFGVTHYFDYLDFRIRGNMVQGTTFRLNNFPANFAQISTDQDCAQNLLGYLERHNAIDGSLHLTKLDTINKIMSGTFHCVIPLPGCDTVHITDGRFDVRYY